MNPEIRIPRRRFLEIAAATSAVALLSGIKPTEASSSFPFSEQTASTTSVGTEEDLSHETRSATFMSTQRRISSYRAIDRLMANPNDIEATRALGLFSGVPDEILEQATTCPEQHPHLKNGWSQTFFIPKGEVVRLSNHSKVAEIPLPQGLKAGVFMLDGGNLTPENGTKSKIIAGNTALHFRKSEDQLSLDVIGLDLGYDLEPKIPEEYRSYITESLPPLVRFTVKHVAGEVGSKNRTETLTRRDFDPSAPTILVMESRNGFDNLLEGWALFNGDRGDMSEDQFPIAKIQG